MTKTCPGCGAARPARARYCDCGHDFRPQGADDWRPSPARPAVTWRAVVRWVVSLAFIALGLWELSRPAGLVLRGTPIPIGWLFVVVGGLGVVGCLFGINVFRGGPLDLRHDDPPHDPRGPGPPRP